MSKPQGQQIKIAGMFRQVAITADASGNLPTRIELLKTGEWPASSNKGPLQETLSSLGEYKRNFDAGIAQSVDADGKPLGLPIDFMHESWDKAGAWIKAMEVGPSSTPDLPPNEGGFSLWASEVEFTTAGREAILGGEFKCFSPSWWPASRGDWTDPEDPNITARNVIDGGGFTNQPFFKGLQSLTASNVGKQDTNNVIFIQADKGASMNLDELRVKEADALTDEEKQFLTDNKADLSTEEQTKFGLAEAPAPAAPVTPEDKNNEENTVVTEEQKEVAALNASIKAGKVVAVDKAEYEALQASVKTLTEQSEASRKAKIEASIAEHVKAGRIIADQSESWTKRAMADETVLDDIAKIPANPLLASEIGDDKGGDGNAVQQLREKATEAIKASKEAGNELSQGDAMSQVRRENVELAKQADAEMRAV